MEEDEDRDDICVRPPSLGCGKVGTGEASFISISDAIWEAFHSRRSRIKTIVRGPVWRLRMLRQRKKGYFLFTSLASGQQAAFGGRNFSWIEIVGRND